MVGDPGAIELMLDRYGRPPGTVTLDEESPSDDQHQHRELPGSRPLGSERNRRDRGDGADDTRAAQAEAERRSGSERRSASA